MILQLPKPTTANERLWPIQLEPKYQVFVNSLLEKNWWKHHGADWFQPLFGLTAKTIDGGERTVVEGDIILWAKNRSGILLWDSDINCFMFRFLSEKFLFYDHSARKECVKDYVILSHCTDIVAAGNVLECWGCGGERTVPKKDACEIMAWPDPTKPQPPAMHETCPTCHGEGTFNIVWKE